MDMKLKSCPFCGGDARLFVNNGVEVQCTKCGIHTETLLYMVLEMSTYPQLLAEKFGHEKKPR